MFDMTNGRPARACALLLIGLLVGCGASDPSPAPATLPPVATLPPPATATAPPTTRLSPAPTFDHSPRPAPADAELAPRLRVLLDDWLTDSETPGGVLAVRLADGRTAVVSSGWRDVDGDQPVEPTDRFRIGSITKTYVAALVLSLADDGLVELDAELATYLPDAPHADQVTIRQLLAHTSGLPDLFLLSEYQTAVFISAGRRWQPADALELVRGEPLEFEPGSSWAYSNTNYLVLGLVAEEVGGASLAELLRARVIEPSGLTDTFLEEMEPGPAVVVAGHHDLDGDGDHDSLTGIPYTALVTSGAAAGGLSSSGLDVLDFAAALFGGRLLSASGLAEMLTPSPHYAAYGLGIGRLVTDGGVAWGHTGALPGFSAVFAGSLEDGGTIVVLGNRSGADAEGLARAVADELLIDPE